jgi:hypothetical protein
MSGPYHQPYGRAAVQPVSSNGLGIAGFVVSLVGILTCGLLCPLGLLLSLFGLLKRPRGMAIAGTVIGLIGTGFMVLVVGLFATALVSKVRTVEVSQKMAQTENVLAEAEQIVEAHRVETGELPGGIEGNKLLFHLHDAWGGSIRYDRLDDHSYLIRSPGEDGDFDTPDDVTAGPGG